MSDDFRNHAATLDAPAFDAAAVTPDDSNDLAKTSRALYVGTTGNIKVTIKGGETLVFSNVPVGILPISAARVWATSTTASNIIALW